MRVAGDRVRPPSDAKTVKRRGGEWVVSDGSFVEAKEPLFGFDRIDCADLDTAIEIASKPP